MKKILKWLDDNIELYICVFLMSFMTLLVFVQVVMRYVFNNSLSWSEELARYTNGRVFDGTEDLIGAFRSVKGYN